MLHTKFRVLSIAALALLLCGASSRADSPNKAKGKAKGDKKWIELFNGKDLSGWKMIGKGDFVVEDGALATQGAAGLGLLYYEARTFRDFVLRVEWKVKTQCSNSGVFVRFPDPWYSVRNGYEIQIDDCDKRGLKNQTGSIYDFSPPTARAAKPAGEWNLYEISVVGQRYTVVLNGQKVNEFDGERGREGYIGLQSHDPISKVWYRNVRVREIE
jgi:hypothetical protein